MKTLTYQVDPLLVNALSDELLAALPTAFVGTDANGDRIATGYVVQIEGGVQITVPDNADEAALAAVVAAHDPAAVEAAQAANQTAAASLRQQILDQAQSAVGVSLSALTVAQRAALTACLLWESGGVTQDMKVRPLSEWLK